MTSGFFVFCFFNQNRGCLLLESPELFCLKTLTRLMMSVVVPFEGLITVKLDRNFSSVSCSWSCMLLDLHTVIKIRIRAVTVTIQNCAGQTNNQTNKQYYSIILTNIITSCKYCIKSLVSPWVSSSRDLHCVRWLDKGAHSYTRDHRYGEVVLTTDDNNSG